MMAYNNFERKSVKRWRKVIFFVLKAMVTKKYVLYSRHPSVVRILTQREFRHQLVILLCQDILVRPAATQHNADTTLERLRGNHYIQRGDRSEGIAMCAAVTTQEKKGTSQSQFMGRAQSALLSSLTHALGLTIHKPASNYCPLKHIVHVS